MKNEYKAHQKNHKNGRRSQNYRLSVGTWEGPGHPPGWHRARRRTALPGPLAAAGRRRCCGQRCGLLRATAVASANTGRYRHTIRRTRRTNTCEHSPKKVHLQHIRTQYTKASQMCVHVHPTNTEGGQQAPGKGQLYAPTPPTHSIVAVKYRIRVSIKVAKFGQLPQVHFATEWENC